MAEGIELYGVFLGPLERLGGQYFVTGSVASSAYGEPRFTQDLDLVLSLGARAVEIHCGVRYVAGHEYLISPVPP